MTALLIINKYYAGASGKSAVFGSNMKIYEVISAEAQLGLWKIISDNVWSAVATQAAQEKREKAEKAERTSIKRPKKVKGGSRTTTSKAVTQISPPSSQSSQQKPADKNTSQQAAATNTITPVNPKPEPSRGPYGAVGLSPQQIAAQLQSTNQQMQTKPQHKTMTLQPPSNTEPKSKPRLSARAKGMIM